MWGTPEGWIPEKMRGLGAASATGDGAGRISVVIERECNRRSLADDHGQRGRAGSALRSLRCFATLALAPRGARPHIPQLATSGGQDLRPRTVMAGPQRRSRQSRPKTSPIRLARAISARSRAGTGHYGLWAQASPGPRPTGNQRSQSSRRRILGSSRCRRCRSRSPTLGAPPGVRPPRRCPRSRSRDAPR